MYFTVFYNAVNHYSYKELWVIFFHSHLLIKFVLSPPPRFMI